MTKKKRRASHFYPVSFRETFKVIEVHNIEKLLLKCGNEMINTDKSLELTGLRRERNHK